MKYFAIFLHNFL